MSEKLGRGRRLYTSFFLLDGSPEANMMPWATIVMCQMMTSEQGSFTVSEIDKGVSPKGTTNYGSIYSAIRILEQSGMIEKNENRTYKTTVLGRRTYLREFNNWNRIK